ncbi:unnamed protein product [Phytomonas sp. EM1]|nr:unnamed protein product [Phytomonas sp. EM1]|eukprot:CCW59807.1 unnamed protein product [Phytomonas sp. isolate EM1]
MFHNKYITPHPSVNVLADMISNHNSSIHAMDKNVHDDPKDQVTTSLERGSNVDSCVVAGLQDDDTFTSTFAISTNHDINVAKPKRSRRPRGKKVSNSFEGTSAADGRKDKEINKTRKRQRKVPCADADKGPTVLSDSNQSSVTETEFKV